MTTAADYITMLLIATLDSSKIVCFLLVAFTGKIIKVRTIVVFGDSNNSIELFQIR